MTIVCALIAGLALAYAVEEWRRLRSGRRLRFVSRGQAHRRILGSLTVVALMILVDVGLELVDPHRQIKTFLAVWGGAVLLTAVLSVLGWLDLHEVRANEDIERVRALVRLGSDGSGESGDGEQTDKGRH